MDFTQAEDKDGVRFTFNVWPSSRIEATRNVVPLACCYSPWKKYPERPVARYHPVTCRGCSAVLNPYCQVDVKAKLWTCPFCVTRNQLPPQYADISETNLPAELIPDLTTLEYRLPQAPVFPPVFLFVIDLALEEEELQGLKDSILMALDLIPENAVIGLMTYAGSVHVYELGFEAMPKAHVFSGERDVSAEKVRQCLGLGGPQRQPGQPAVAAALSSSNMFLRPFSSCRTHLESILEELQRDPTPTAPGKRPKRATGVAMAVAVGLMEASVALSPGRIMLFTGGPCTVGPGATASDALTDMMRSHHDISKDNAPFVASGTAYNDGLATRAAQASHVVDIFTCALDQTGLLEQISFLRRGGGVAVLEDTFQGKEFQESFRRVFLPYSEGAPELDMAFNSTIEVLVSKELRVMGMVGPGISGGKKSTAVSETAVGVGGTTAWRIPASDHRTTPAFFFEVVNQHNQAIATQFGVMQFVTNYSLSTGEKVTRVTTVARSWGNYAQDPLVAQQQVEAGFDQETAAVIMARLAMTKTDVDSPFDIIRWVDRSLIRFVQKVGQYTKDQPASFSLQPHFSLFPQFMFHLRRSPFLQVFNNSPDETAFQRYLLSRERVANCVTMIQPTLDRYTFNGPPEPALLSANTLSPDVILLLDTFFQVVIWTGSTMAEWRKKGFQNDPNYASFKALLAAPRFDAEAIVEERFPVPRIIECDQHTSQARFLTASVDPCITYNNTGPGAQPGGEAIFTEDVSLSVFMEHLKKLAVQPQ